MGPSGGNETEVEELRRLLEESSAQQAVLALNTRFKLCCKYGFNPI